MKTEIIFKRGRYCLVQDGKTVLQANTLLELLKFRNKQVNTGFSEKELEMFSDTLEEYYPETEETDPETEAANEEAYADYLKFEFARCGY